MNVLFALSQTSVTGAEVYAAQIADALIAKKYKVVIASDTLNTKTQAVYEKLCLDKRGFLKRIANIYAMVKFIKKHDIQLVNAHSRASSWVAFFACKIARIPLIVTIHGKQKPKSFSRTIIKAFGFQTIAVAPNIRTQIAHDFNFDQNNIHFIPNGIKMPSNKEFKENLGNPKVLQKLLLISRPTGPKGEIAHALACALDGKAQLFIAGKGFGQDERFCKFKTVHFLGHVKNVMQTIEQYDGVIGGGRVAIEALLCQKNVFIVGEALCLGWSTGIKLQEAIDSNFGDIVLNKELPMNFEKMAYELLTPQIPKAPKIVCETVSKIYSLPQVYKKLERVFAQTLTHFHQKAMPILMYHRVIKAQDEKGIHSTYIFKNQLEEHFKVLKTQGFKTLTFSDLQKMPLHERFGKKLVILTFDDGYTDNYENLLPLLKKYNFKAVIYLTNQNYNRWDVKNKKNPEKKFNLMDAEQIKTMKQSGLVEFGGHTLSHPKLSQLTNPNEVAQEIIENERLLKQNFGLEVPSFAYPYGDLNEEVKTIVKSKTNYYFAVATDSGSAVLEDDLFEIRRIGIFPNINVKHFKKRINGHYVFVRIQRNRRK